jgi:hypothetical protein
MTERYELTVPHSFVSSVTGHSRFIQKEEGLVVFSTFYTLKKIRIVGNLCYYQKPFWVSEPFGNLLKEFPNGSETQKGF